MHFSLNKPTILSSYQIVLMLFIVRLHSVADLSHNNHILFVYFNLLQYDCNFILISVNMRRHFSAVHSSS